jgi:Tfp pilus assembly protein PilF
MDPREIRDLIDEARSALESGDHPRAMELSLRLVGECPQDVEVRLLRAKVLLYSDAGDEALAEARRVAEMVPVSDEAQTLLGLAAWRSGHLTLAQDSLQRAIRLSGRRPGLLADYAWFMAQERGPKLAEEAAREAIAANQNSSTAWAALGRAQFRLHRYPQAEASLQRALKLDPNDPYAQQAMMDLLHQRRQDGKAVALASLLQDTPGTEQLVEKVRSEAVSRQIARKLLERRAMPEPNFDNPRHRWNWLFVAAFLMTGLLLLLQPATPTAFAICVIVPMILLYPIRRLLG